MRFSLGLRLVISGIVGLLAGPGLLTLGFLQTLTHLGNPDYHSAMTDFGQVTLWAGIAVGLGGVFMLWLEEDHVTTDTFESADATDNGPTASLAGPGPLP